MTFMLYTKSTESGTNLYGPFETMCGVVHAYHYHRDASGEGQTTWVKGEVFEGTKMVAILSYNGRINEV
jgi:hypothetical protein